MLAKIRKIPRDQHRLEVECKVRLEHNLPVLTEENRLKFLLLVDAELHPNAPLSQYIKAKIYEDPQFFEKMDLTSLATIERDNREIERAGLFMKEKDVPVVVEGKPIQQQQQLTF